MADLRITHISPELKAQLKIAAIQDGMTLREFVKELALRELTRRHKVSK
jgi:hypothetical protein